VPAPEYTGPGSWTPAQVAGYLAGGVDPDLLRAVLARFPHPDRFEASAATDPVAHAAAGWPAPHPPLQDLPAGTWVTVAGTPTYPARLLRSPGCPLALFGAGAPGVLERAGLAVTGGATVAALGRAVITAAVAGLAAHAPVVAELAPGVAHAAVTSATRSGRPVVVVSAAHPADLTGPAAIAARAVLDAGGAVVSPSPPGTTVPAVGAVVAGLAAAVLYAEGPGGQGMGPVWAAISAGRPVLVAHPRGAGARAPGARGPLALGWDTRRSAEQLRAMGAPAAVADHGWVGPLASGVAPDRDTLTAMVTAVTGLAA
jgi:DNA processing protein